MYHGPGIACGADLSDAGDGHVLQHGRLHLARLREVEHFLGDQREPRANWRRRARRALLGEPLPETVPRRALARAALAC